MFAHALKMSAQSNLLSFRLIAHAINRLPPIKETLLRLYVRQRDNFPRVLSAELWIFDLFLIVGETILFALKPVLMLVPRLRPIVRRQINLVGNVAALNLNESKLRHYRRNNPANAYLNFAQSTLDLAAELDAEVFLAHGVQALPAAFSLSSRLGRAFYCDCIETPSFFDRSIPSEWHVTNTELLDHAFESYLRRADGLLTIGWALARDLGELNSTVTPIPNYRAYETVEPTDRLREMCGVEAGDEIVLSLSTVTSGFGEIIKALTLLPDNVHLASIGNYVPSGYGDECRALADSLGVPERYHVFSPVPYQELLPTISSADAGLFVCDTSIRNNAISLPNRVFDFMAAGVPLCAPEIPDIAKIVTSEGMGGVVHELSGAGWAATIKAVLDDKKQRRNNAFAAAKKYTWESLEPGLFEALGKPASICIIGATDLTINNRTLRIARSLRKAGCRVTICFLVKLNDERVATYEDNDGIRYVPVRRVF